MSKVIFRTLTRANLDFSMVWLQTAATTHLGGPEGSLLNVFAHGNHISFVDFPVALIYPFVD